MSTVRPRTAILAIVLAAAGANAWAQRRPALGADALPPAAAPVLESSAVADAGIDDGLRIFPDGASAPTLPIQVDAPPGHAPMDAGASNVDSAPAAANSGESRLIRRTKSATASRPKADSVSDTGSAAWLRTTLSLGGVVALIVLLSWGYRVAAGTGRGLPFMIRPRNAGLVEVVARTPLSARQSLCLVRVGPRLVLVGMSPERLSALDVIDDPELAAQVATQAGRQRPDSQAAAFHRVLEAESRGPAAEDDEVDETVAPEDLRLVNVRERLAGALERIRARTGA